ncbi:hypothetical protein BCL69_10703 [Nitrosomonas communis]|uniref:Uncharacterized protein n=1 Tax=Nitrosomonas communis TaxID=44574 RepID=A0A5D3YAJ3_9PROT|nr:hypothetical protein BCL69_10703 [Nitrosomonas communis]
MLRIKQLVEHNQHIRRNARWLLRPTRVGSGRSRIYRLFPSPLRANRRGIRQAARPSPPHHPVSWHKIRTNQTGYTFSPNTKISKLAAYPYPQRLELSFHTMRIFACSFGLLLQLLCFGYAGLQILNTRSMGRMCREKFDGTRALTCLLHF